MSLAAIPANAEQFSAAMYTQLIQQVYPSVVVEQATLVQSLQYGEGMVSTAARAVVDLDYRVGTAADLPTRVVLKLAYDLDLLPSPLYQNEVNFYRRLRPEINLETPRTLGAQYDSQSRHFALLLEDLSGRQARFPNALTNISIAEVHAVLDNLAQLHAHYWQSPRFNTDLAWLETHVSGDLADFMNTAVPPAIEHEISINHYKQELMSKLATTAPALLRGLKAVQQHQSRLPQTVLHGDSHIGNMYFLPSSAGLLDWQLMARGYCMHDINYFITTALSIDQRRKHERSLLGYYLERLAYFGVAQPPDFDEAWTEYCRTLIWGVYIGWMTTNVANYGWEINTVNLLRLTTAYDDLGTAALVNELLD